MQTEYKRTYVKPSELIIYGVANGGQCMSWNIISGYITYFFVNVFNIDARIVSAMLFIEGIWDTVNDPIMGSVIDRTRTRYGKLKPYLIFVPIPLAITTVALFAGPVLLGNLDPDAPQKVAYMVITYFVWEFFYTIGDVPFWGMSACISPNTDDRTKAISGARFISSIVGGIPGLAIPILLDLVNAKLINTSLRTVFLYLGTFTGIAGMGLFMLSGIFVKERVVQASDAPSFSQCLKSLYTNKPLRLLILKDVLGTLGNIGGPFSTYYTVDVLGSASSSLITGIPWTIMNFAGYAMIPFFKRLMDNRRLIIFTKSVGVVQAVLKYLICIGNKRYTRLSFMMPYIALEGIIGGVMGSLNGVIPPEMIGETVDYSEWTTGQRSEGISFSVLTFVGKFSGSISRAIGTWLIPVIGYKTSNTSAFVKQSAKTKRLIFAMTTIVPQLLGLVSFIPMFMYDLVGGKRDRMYSELVQMRAQRARESDLKTAP